MEVSSLLHALAALTLEKSPIAIGKATEFASVCFDGSREKNSLAPLGIRTPAGPARSESLLDNR
jgi:hypothetical protein